MTAVPKAMRSMRIIALPLTRPNPTRRVNLSPHPSTSADKQSHTDSIHLQRTLTYYHFQITVPPSYTDSGSGEKSWNVVRWVTNKASEAWAGFGKANEGSWKLKVFQAGERLVDRLDFEELALKGIDPSLGPPIAHPDLNEKEHKDAKSRPPLTIPLIYPPSVFSGPASLLHLRELLAYRTPRHRKGFYTWMIIAPFTAPFMIIPIIPNLPFFFCVWRSWSHYRAYRASQYLSTLIENDTLVPESSPALDAIYEEHAPSPTLKSSPDSSSVNSPESSPEPPHSTSSASPEARQPQHSLLLTRSAVPALLELFGLKPAAAADMYRAVEQARARVLSGREEL